MKTHNVTPEDSKRIKCKGLSFLDHCNKPAVICEHREWETGNKAGISFYYYCQACFDASLQRRMK